MTQASLLPDITPNAQQVELGTIRQELLATLQHPIEADLPSLRECVGRYLSREESIHGFELELSEDHNELVLRIESEETPHPVLEGITRALSLITGYRITTQAREFGETTEYQQIGSADPSPIPLTAPDLLYDINEENEEIPTLPLVEAAREVLEDFRNGESLLPNADHLEPRIRKIMERSTLGANLTLAREGETYLLHISDTVRVLESEVLQRLLHDVGELTSGRTQGQIRAEIAVDRDAAMERIWDAIKDEKPWGCEVEQGGRVLRISLAGDPDRIETATLREVEKDTGIRVEIEPYQEDSKAALERPGSFVVMPRGKWRFLFREITDLDRDIVKFTSLPRELGEVSVKRFGDNRFVRVTNDVQSLPQKYRELLTERLSLIGVPILFSPRGRRSEVPPEHLDIIATKSLPDGVHLRKLERDGDHVTFRVFAPSETHSELARWQREVEELNRQNTSYKRENGARVQTIITEPTLTEGRVFNRCTAEEAAFLSRIIQRDGEVRSEAKLKPDGSLEHHFRDRAAFDAAYQQLWRPPLGPAGSMRPGNTEWSRHASGTVEDLTDLTTMSFDTPRTSTYEDAVSVEKFNGGWRLYVHVPRISRFMPPGSAHFDLARRRFKTVGTDFGSQSIILPMVSNEILDQVGSFDRGRPRQAWTAVIEVAGDNVEILPWRETIVKSDGAHSPEDVSTALSTRQPRDVLDTFAGLFEVCKKLSHRRYQRSEAGEALMHEPLRALTNVVRNSLKEAGLPTLDVIQGGNNLGPRINGAGRRFESLVNLCQLEALHGHIHPLSSDALEEFARRREEWAIHRKDRETFLATVLRLRESKRRIPPGTILTGSIAEPDMSLVRIPKVRIGQINSLFEYAMLDMGDAEVVGDKIVLKGGRSLENGQVARFKVSERRKSIILGHPIVELVEE